uniref:ubiquitinyl hydrolase 1 n=1 Tax=Tetradesmus obliquus TaxID=3088 RepID=A0A383WM21_TETOB|eukprot:jgi/Sobl393_1/628/SZX78510.1
MIHLVGAGIGVLIIVVFIYASIAGLWRDSQDLRQHVFAARTSLDGEPWWERSAIARRMSIDAGLCRVCSKPTTTHCSRCKSVKYCSIACQRKDWGSNHKFECDNLQKQAAAQTAAAALGSSSGHPASNGSLSKPPPLDPNEDAPVPRQVLFSYQHYLQLCHNRTSCRRPPIGLTNHGNNCYANSALQCLLASRPLRAYLDQGLHSRDCNKPGNEWCLLCQLQVLCKRMAEAPVGSEVSVRPLLSHLRRFAKTLSLGRQEDAHEFFYSLLNTLEAIQLTNYGGKERFDMRTQETTLVHHVFGGYLRSQVVCGGCGAASRRYEACLDLQLEVPGGVDRLEDALARHTAEEVLDGDNRYACDGCGRRCRACRSTRFEVAPNSLVLCLKRFGTGRFGKINKVLVYGEALDLSPFMAQQAMDEGPVTYTLSGVIVHLDQMNSTSFGHYICFVRTADGRWYICDDARVAPTSPSRVLSQNAYMLFYTRDTPKPAPQPGYKRQRPLTPAAAAPHQQQQDAAAVNGVAEEAAMQQQQQPLASEHLARVSTAPAALVRMGDELASSSSKDEEELAASLTSSSSGVAAAGAGSSGCSTPLAAAAAAAAAGAAATPQQQQSPEQRQQDDSRIGSSADSSGSLRKAADTQQQQQQQDGSAAAESVTGAAVNGSSILPAVVYSLKRVGPELLQLRAHLPGVQQASQVCVDVVNAGPQLQRLLLKVPGRFAALEVPLLPVLGAGSAAAAAGSGSAAASDASAALDSTAAAAAAGAQVVAAVSGKLYRRRQVLSLKLHLAAAGSSSGSSGSSSNAADSTVHWHSTDSGPDVASSSGSESDSSLVLVPMRSMRAVMSEMDLNSFFGRHSTAGQQAMQGLRHGRQQQQQQRAAAAAAAAAAGQDGVELGDSATAGGGGGSVVAGGGVKQAGSKKGSSSKKGSKGKKKR